MVDLHKPEALREALSHLRVLIIGDVMIDSYVWGQATRLSPEAPVPVVNVKKREWRLGGAANVALNIQALGATAILCGILGDDQEADRFEHIMQQHKLSTAGLLRIESRPTTIKHRIIAGTQQLLRVDAEDDTPIKPQQAQKLWQCIAAQIEHVHLIIFEDYDKGSITPWLIRQVVDQASQHAIPVTVDPKRRNFFAYEGVTLFKPNLKELQEATANYATPLSVEFKQNVEALRKRLCVEHLVVTLSEKGLYWQKDQQEWHIPAHLRNIADVSGAGDTVISVASICLALGLAPEVCARLANLAGGIVCEYPGVVPLPQERFFEELAQQAPSLTIKD